MSVTDDELRALLDRYVADSVLATGYRSPMDRLEGRKRGQRLPGLRDTVHAPQVR